MKRIRSAFVTGILVLIPLYLTIDILRWFISSIDNSAKQYLHTVLPFDFPGLGLLLALTVIFLVGALTQNYVGKYFVDLFDSLIRRLSIVGGIYGGIKKFLETILNPRSDKFNGVCLVQFPRDGLYSVGFRTGNPDSKLQKSIDKKLVNVFVPCTPNPTSGFYLLVPEKDLLPLNVSVQEAFKIVISMGIVTSEEAQQLIQK